jgi:U3 small nucleolar RNA-associated protein 13
MIASVSNDNSLKLWDGIPKLKTRTEGISLVKLIVEEITQSKRSINAHEKDINVVKFSPNQKLLATSS